MNLTATRFTTLSAILAPIAGFFGIQVPKTDLGTSTISYQEAQGMVKGIAKAIVVQDLNTFVKDGKFYTKARAFFNTEVKAVTSANFGTTEARAYLIPAKGTEVKGCSITKIDANGTELIFVAVTQPYTVEQIVEQIVEAETKCTKVMSILPEVRFSGQLKGETPWLNLDLQLTFKTDGVKPIALSAIEPSIMNPFQTEKMTYGFICLDGQLICLGIATPVVTSK